MLQQRGEGVFQDEQAHTEVLLAVDSKNFENDDIADRTTGSSAGSINIPLTASVAETYLSFAVGNDSYVQLLTKGVLRCLDASTVERCRRINKACKTLIEDGTESDFELQMGKILYLRNRHNDEFRRHLIQVENMHIRRVLLWVICDFVLLPLFIILHFDYQALPDWCVPVPAYLALVSIFLPDGFDRTPRSGHAVLTNHEHALWSVTAKKLFSASDRRFLRLWSLALSAIPCIAALTVWPFPGVLWLPYIALVPGLSLMLIPIASRYRQTRHLGVMWRQILVTAWIGATAMVSWFLATSGADIIQKHFCSLVSCQPELFLLLLLEVLVWALIICLFTLSFPAAFAVLNFTKKWYTTAVCGFLGLCLELTILCSLHYRPPMWHFGGWLLLMGLIGSVRLAATLFLRRLAGFTDCWCAERASKPMGAERFVMPPLLPPTISETPFEPGWRNVALPQGRVRHA